MIDHSRAARAVPTLLAAVLAALALAVVGAGSAASSASAATSHPVVYDALGDSYASGYGVPPYSSCGRSDSAYAVQLDGRMRISLDDFVACAGATTGTVVSDGQLAALDADTDLVTISAGGNDIGWSRVVGACLLADDATCTGARQAVTGVILQVLPGLLDSLYSQVEAAAPNAHVVVTGYPHLFSPEYGSYLGASPEEQQGLNEGADLLDSVLASAAAAHGFQFVGVTDRFVDHGVNAPEPWVTGAFDPAAFHPNRGGYQAYTAALTSAINPRSLR